MRDLQSGEAAGEIMRRVRAAAPDIPVLVKIAPDMRHEEAIGLGELALAENIDGLIISNTRWRAMAWRVAHMPTRQAVYQARRFSKRRPICCAPFTAPSVTNGGKLTLIGVGGVSSAAVCQNTRRASLVQLYTGLVYEGPGLVARMKRDLAARLRADRLPVLKKPLSDVKETK